MAARLTRPRNVTGFWLLMSLTLLVFPVSGFAERVEDLPKPTDYVSDYAHVLSPATIGQLDRLCSRLDHSATNTQVAIVTVHNLDGDDKADFANRLEEKWKVGKKGSDRGVLMLVSTEDHHYWIEVGYGLEGILPDGKVGDIGRRMVPQLHAHDYDAAITTGLVLIANVIAADAKVSLDQPGVRPQPQYQPMPRRHVSSIGVLFRILIIVLVLVFLGVRGLFGLGLGLFLGGRGGWGGGGYGGGGGGWGGGDGGGGDSGFGGFGGGESGGGGAGGDF